MIFKNARISIPTTRVFGKYPRVRQICPQMEKLGFLETRKLNWGSAKATNHCGTFTCSRGVLPTSLVRVFASSSPSWPRAVFLPVAEPRGSCFPWLYGIVMSVVTGMSLGLSAALHTLCGATCSCGALRNSWCSPDAPRSPRTCSPSPSQYAQYHHGDVPII